MSAESRQCCRRCTPWSPTTGWWSPRGRTGSASRGSTSTGPQKQTSSPSGLNISLLSAKCQSVISRGLTVWHSQSLKSKANTLKQICVLCLPPRVLNFNLCDIDHLVESNLKFVRVLWMRREVNRPSERITWEEEQRGKTGKLEMKQIWNFCQKQSIQAEHTTIISKHSKVVLIFCYIGVVG